MPRKQSRGNRNIAWIERYCRIPSGDLLGQPVKLTRKQKQWIRQVYDTPTRLFILSMGRGNAKTAFAAMLLLLHLEGPEARPNSDLYSAAQSREQAALLFDYAVKMVRMDEDLLAVTQVRDAAKELLCPELGTRYRALSAEASTAYGLNPAFVVHDELGQVKGPRSALYEALETASSKQPDPLSIVISTQAPTDADLLSVLIDDALKGDDPKTKISLHTAPKEIDPFGEEAIRAANPHYDEFMNQSEVMRMAEAARRIPTKEAEYRNLVLNQRVEMRAPLIPESVWRANGGAVRSEQPKGPMYFGLDLSSVSDLTALVGVSEPVGQDGPMDVYSTFWLPEQGLAHKSRADRVPYDVWAEQGFLQTTPGASIEYEFVAEHLRWLFDNVDVRGLAFDRYNMKFLRPWLIRVGFSEEELKRFVEFGQGFVSMSPAIRELESLLLATKLRHAMHPVLTMCAANAQIAMDAAANRKFTKAKATGRIDGMVALAMAVGLALIERPSEPQYQMLIVGGKK